MSDTNYYWEDLATSMREQLRLMKLERDAWKDTARRRGAAMMRVRPGEVRATWCKMSTEQRREFLSFIIAESGTSIEALGRRERLEQLLALRSLE